MLYYDYVKTFYLLQKETIIIDNNLTIWETNQLFVRNNYAIRFFIVLNKKEYIATVSFNSSTQSCKIIDALGDTSVKEIENSVYRIIIEDLKELQSQISEEFPEQFHTA